MSYKGDIIPGGPHHKVQISPIHSQEAKPYANIQVTNKKEPTSAPFLRFVRLRLLPSRESRTADRNSALASYLLKQTQNYEVQISNKKQNQEEVITYGQPESEKDEVIIEKLKATVNEIAINKNKLEEENLKLREDLKMYQNQCQIRNHVYREEHYHRSEQERMKTEISDLTEELHQKEITIATIMEKASLLERQLKMELEIKEKLLATQQSIDLSNKEHGNFTASIHKLEHENVRLQNSRVKLQNDTETSILGHMDTYGETEHSYQTHSKMQEKEKRTPTNINIRPS
ncbi:deuterosome assembly protein 1 [Grus japonensis]|uniref:Deuterosome assembly protein 1 n=1 Tax=Grus japonensis TaxID=30415 RepID=A0ABC9W6F1_GRUJA